MQVQQWCGGSNSHVEACAFVRDFADELVVAGLQKLVQALGIEDIAADVHAAHTCLKSPSNFTLPDDGYYMPLAWIDEHSVVRSALIEKQELSRHFEQLFAVNTVIHKRIKLQTNP